jgi:hypothetical protein
MPRFDLDNLRRGEFAGASVRVPDVDLSTCEKTDMCVHAEVGADDRFHVGGPTKADRIDHAFDPASASLAHIELNPADLPALGSIDRCDKRVCR